MNGKENSVFLSLFAIPTFLFCPFPLSLSISLFLAILLPPLFFFLIVCPQCFSLGAHLLILLKVSLTFSFSTHFSPMCVLSYNLHFLHSIEIFGSVAPYVLEYMGRYIGFTLCV